MMDFKYMRIQGRELSYVTQYPKGIFGMCWRMIYDGVMQEEDAETFREIDRWFVENLPEPPMCKTGDQRVVTFFKTESTEEMMKHIEPAMKLLDKYNHPYDVVYTNFVGNIVYEDEFQVAVSLD
ncbi:MAG: hypothetical protein J6C07_01095 [Lachnospiraceae bacterium]|nr:hypothetical protein [Lachnospiraceae bacterium]